MIRFGWQVIPVEALNLYRKGRELSGQKQYEEAARCYREAIILAPSLALALHEFRSCRHLAGKTVVIEKVFSLPEPAISGSGNDGENDGSR